MREVLDWLDANLTRDPKLPRERRWIYVGPAQPDGAHGVRVARDTMCVVVDGDTVHMWGIRDGRCARGRVSRAIAEPGLVPEMSEALAEVRDGRTPAETADALT